MSGAWFFDLRERAALATEARVVLEAEWCALSTELAVLESAQVPLKAVLDVPSRLATDRDASGWAPVLREIASAAESHVRIENIRAREAMGGSDGWEIVIDGVARGKQSRASADQFRHVLEARIQGQPGLHAATVSFRRLEDSLDSNFGGGEGASFTLIVRPAKTINISTL